jgi:uncharacterized membrane protein
MAMDPKGTTHETLEERMLHRMLFFTDAVFAIVMTLLVLELRPPGGEVTLSDLSAKLFAFTLSFLILAVFWIVHLIATRRLIHFDGPTAVANLAFLFPVCLIPFGSAWIGQTKWTVQGWTAYCLILIATSLANVILVLVETRGGGRLIGGITGRQRAFRLTRSGAPALAFVAALVATRTGHVAWAPSCAVLIPILILAASRILRPEAGA